MNKSNALIDFSPRRYRDCELPQKAQLIVDKMTGNPNFPDLQPLVLQVKEANDQYCVSLEKATDGTKADTALKKAHRVHLQKLLNQLGQYVEQTSSGDKALILNSGFDIYKTRGKIGPLDQARGLNVKYGLNSGEIVIQCNVIKNALRYEFCYTPEPVTAHSRWLIKASTKHKVLITGLTASMRYAFRAAGAGTDHSRNWSDTVSKLVV